MKDGQFLLKLTLEITNYFANKQDHVMKVNRVTSCIITHFFLKTSLELTRPVGKSILNL